MASSGRRNVVHISGDSLKTMATSDKISARERMEMEMKDELESCNFDVMKNYIRKYGQKMLVNDVELYYEVVGNGPHPILLCPGTSGTIASDFLPQMLPGGFDREKFTVVTLDLRGYGGSVPPKRTSYPPGYQEQDAKDAVALMEKLGFKSFTWIGWCGGGNTGIIAAALFPDNIKSLIVWGAYTTITKGAYDAASTTKTLDGWSDRMLAPRLLEYERKYLEELWYAHYKYKAWVYEKNNGDCLGAYTSRVRCPILIMWMKLDYYMDKEQIDQLVQAIPHAKLLVVEDGKHAFHLKYPQRFRAIVEEYLGSLPSSIPNQVSV